MHPHPLPILLCEPLSLHFLDLRIILSQLHFCREAPLVEDLHLAVCQALELALEHVVLGHQLVLVVDHAGQQLVPSDARGREL